MQWLEFVYPFKVRFSDTDAYGIVHHSRYYCYFEEARYEFTKQCLNLFSGYPEGNSLKFPVISSSCGYRRSLEYTLEEMYIRLRFRILDGCKVEFTYEVKKEGKSIIYAKGRTVHAILENEKLCLTVPEWIKEKIRRSIEDV